MSVFCKQLNPHACRTYLIGNDGEIALIAIPDLSICGYSDNPFLVEHLESFLRASIEASDDE